MAHEVGVDRAAAFDFLRRLGAKEARKRSWSGFESRGMRELRNVEVVDFVKHGGSELFGEHSRGRVEDDGEAARV